MVPLLVATNKAMTNRYRAFISYSHSDEKWAKWLLRCLEAYRVPGRIVERYGLDTNRLIPIFRDREELASSGDLSATIQNALTESASLIVICSPAAAASRWVNEEVKVFKQMGKGDQVFCLLVGDPSNSFPPEVLVDTDGDGVATAAETSRRLFFNPKKTRTAGTAIRTPTIWARVMKAAAPSAPARAAQPRFPVAARSTARSVANRRPKAIDSV